MTVEKHRAGNFRDVRSRALRVRVDVLKKQLDAVSRLCDVAENTNASVGANASVAAETVERARIAFDRVLEQLRDARQVSARDAEGLQGKVMEIKARLLKANERLRELRGEAGTNLACGSADAVERMTEEPRP